MSAGKLTGKNSDGLAFNSGTVTITGGEITGKWGIYSYGSTSKTLTLGNNSDSTVSQDSPKITGTSTGVYFTNISTFNFYDGIITGSPIFNPSDTSNVNIPEGYTIITSGNSATLDKISTIEDIASIQFTAETTYGNAFNKSTIGKNSSNFQFSRTLYLSRLKQYDEAPTLLEAHLKFYDKNGNELERIYNPDKKITISAKNNGDVPDSRYCNGNSYSMPTMWIGVASLDKKVFYLDYSDTNLDSLNNAYIRFDKEGYLPTVFSSLDIYFYSNPYMVKTNSGIETFSINMFLKNDGASMASLITTSTKSASYSSSKAKSDSDVADVAYEIYKKYFK